MIKLYPLKFKAEYHEKIWGGQKIKTVLGKDYGKLPNCGETWEISGVKGHESIVSEGGLKGKSLAGLLCDYKDELIGKRVFEKSQYEFPLLVKFISAAGDLSIQVHPDDDLAKQRHNSLGKSEMWYILDADKNSTLISGFNRPFIRRQYLEAFESGKLMDILNVVEVKKGDCFYIPAGRLHSIGKGILLAEVQQASDITYRVYDFERRDENGNERELHVKESLDALDFNCVPDVKSHYSTKKNLSVTMVESPYFTTNILELDKSVKKDYSALDSFVIYICAEGAVAVSTGQGGANIKTGECLLIPAAIKNLTLQGRGTVLEVYVTKKDI